MNTITLSCFPSRVIFNEVWFGYKAWGPSFKVMDNGDEIINSDKSD